jgi:hypothetical protein
MLGQERDAIIAWTLQCVARQPEAIAERCCAAIDQSTCQLDKPLIPESLGRRPGTSRPVAAEDLFARSNVLTIF